MDSIAGLEYFVGSGNHYLVEEPDWFLNVGSALNRHEASLRCINFEGLRYSIGFDTAQLSLLHQSQQLNLSKDFVQLKTLYAPINSILDPSHYETPNQLMFIFDALPPCIEELLIVLPPRWDPKQLLDVQSLWNPDRASNLKILDIRCLYKEPDALPTILLSLCKYFAKTSLRFRFLVDVSHSTEVWCKSCNVEHMEDALI